MGHAPSVTHVILPIVDAQEIGELYLYPTFLLEGGNVRNVVRYTLQCIPAVILVERIILPQVLVYFLKDKEILQRLPDKNNDQKD